MHIFRQFNKNRGPRIVNIFGLSVILACVLISYSQVKKELNYDRFHENAERMVRLTLQYDSGPVDGRIYGNGLQPLLSGIPEIEQVARLHTNKKALVTYRGDSLIVDNLFFVSGNFFEVFTIPLVEGEKDRVFRSAMKDVVVTEEFARRVFGKEPAVGKELHLNGSFGGQTLFVTGVCKSIPTTSHFHSDLFIYQPEEVEVFNYTYLLLAPGADPGDVEQKITGELAREENRETTVQAHLMPLTDIHLHSRNLREIEPNGNMLFVYLVIGANVLLLCVVLFNLWLNSSLIFSFRHRYYCLLRLSGASASDVLKQEGGLALLLAGSTFALAAVWISLIVLQGYFPLDISWAEIGGICFIFLLLIVGVSLVPVFSDLSSTLFRHTGPDIKPLRFSYTHVRFMLLAQYAMVMLVVILSFGIVRQMNLVKETQTGGAAPDIVILEDQTEPVKQRYGTLKEEWLKHSAVESVTAGMQVPGDAIRDYVKVIRDDQVVPLPLMVVDEGFLPFFQVRPIAGRIFQPGHLTYAGEEKLLQEFLETARKSAYTEEYMLNPKAVEMLGYDSPEAAVGQPLRLDHGYVDYIDHGVICGVTEDFHYTGLHESSIPLILLQRQLFLNCTFVRIDSTRTEEALGTVHGVWQEVNPDIPMDYTFLQDIFRATYRNELNAERLVLIFSFLCLLVANLGLVIFMAFIIRRRTKEIGIRKINGALNREIVRLLNIHFLRWILAAFLIAVPAGYLILRRWLGNFAYRTELSWWVFALAGLSVLLLSVLAVSWQSWRAATANPADAVKSE